MPSSWSRLGSCSILWRCCCAGLKIRVINSQVYIQTFRALGATAVAMDPSELYLALQQGVVRWSDLTILQGLQLLPEARGKQTLFDNCLSCHGFQSKMAAVVTDEDGWKSVVAATVETSCSRSSRTRPLELIRGVIARITPVSL